ncbi:MAG: hypothetical protein IPP56_16580 [Bacteroidetes bacterium]|nr:hypothetical protein [Bacteroidota bacterium]MBK9801262.1 hypothetical protein [Bacteroidota bacterium]
MKPLPTEQYIKLKLVTFFESKSSKRIRYAFILAVIFAFIIGPIYAKLYGYDFAHTIFETLALLIFGISIIGYNLSDKTKQTGSIELNDDGIFGNQNGVNFHFDKSEISAIRFFYTGYEGEPYYNKLMKSREGDGNFLTINSNQSKSTYNLFIDNIQQANFLRRLFNYYAETGTKVETENFEL